VSVRKYLSKLIREFPDAVVRYVACVVLALKDDVQMGLRPPRLKKLNNYVELNRSATVPGRVLFLLKYLALSVRVQSIDILSSILLFEKIFVKSVF
jgi:hypothetical protein